MLSEADYLDLQAARAVDRLKLTARTLADELLEPIDVRPLIKSHPWWSLGAAGVGGFLSGLRLGRRKLDTAARRAASRSHRLLAVLHRRVWPLLRSAVGTAMVAGLRGNAAAPTGAPQPNGNGVAPRPPEA